MRLQLGLPALTSHDPRSGLVHFRAQLPTAPSRSSLEERISSEVIYIYSLWNKSVPEPISGVSRSETAMRWNNHQE